MSLTDEKSLKESRISSHSSKASHSMVVTIWKIFLVCFACVLIALLLVAILAIEVDVDLFVRIRRMPEVEIFQTELYDPFKGFVREKFHKITNNLNLTFQ